LKTNLKNIKETNIIFIH